VGRIREDRAAAQALVGVTNIYFDRAYGRPDGMIAMRNAARIVMRRLFAALAMTLCCDRAGHALDAEEQQARALLKEFCGRCHAIGKTGQSPHPYAPPFRDLGENMLYDESFSQRLQNGLSTIHPDMPTFHFSQRDAGAVIEYLRAIQSKPRR
jgi:mono/diheme cytochrome c family protein